MAAPATFELPVFPLGTVLFPDGRLPLRIFEPRYLRMVAQCLKTQGGFVVALLREGREVGPGARFHAVGTLAQIVDFEQGPDGMLHITARGAQRVQIVSSAAQRDHLLRGQVLALEPEPATGIAARHAGLVQHLADRYRRLDADLAASAQLDDATWVGFRLAELLPLPPQRRQYLLELTNPTLRLEVLAEAMAALAGAQDGPPRGH